MEKQFQHKEKFWLESGQSLPEITITYHTWGNPKNPTVWICHALTGNSNAADWWSGIVGEGKLFDPQKYFIVCANMLGSCYGSTNALSINPETQQPYYHQFPILTNRDIVSAFDLLRKHLNIEQINIGIGGSMGGQQVLEWAIWQPTLFKNLVLLASNAQHSAWGIAFNEAQRMAIEADQTWKENHSQAGSEGMKAARAIALLSYRNYHTYQNHQTDTETEKIDQFRAASYQQYQGLKLQKRFHAYAYWTLSKAMDSHHVGRNRGSVEQALATVTAKTLVIAIKTDILFPPDEQRVLYTYIPDAQYIEIQSLYGHDGFLIEYPTIETIITQKLQLSHQTLNTQIF
ncbi:MAG: homoserine O-acetyltransferase [Cytophagales bacterium]|nr:MAG: homoserine O-acetyltransferase [Cytophagales bacterium]